MSINGLKPPYDVIVGDPDRIKLFRIGTCDDDFCELEEKSRYDIFIDLDMRKF